MMNSLTLRGLKESQDFLTANDTNASILPQRFGTLVRIMVRYPLAYPSLTFAGFIVSDLAVLNITADDRTSSWSYFRTLKAFR